MRWTGWVLLIPLCGCQVEADSLEQALDDSLERQDYRLIVQAGRGEVAPGIAVEEQAMAKGRCGVRYLDGLGDTIVPGQEESHARLSAYAAEYNRRMVSHCPLTVDEQE